MKKGILLLLALALLCMGITALAEESEAVKLEVNTANLPVYEAGDPYLTGFVAEGDSTLPVLLLPVKKSLQLRVNVSPKTVKNKNVTLTAENEELVRIQGTSVTGLATGETVLTIASQQDPSVVTQYRLAVIQPVTRLTLTAEAKSVNVGETMTLTPVIQPENATRQEVAWTSGDERIATVDAEGRVTGVKRGTVRIIATAADGSNVRANISVQVTQPAKEITLDQADVTVDVKRNAVVKATVLPQDTNDKKVIWSSSDESIATVNAQGRVTGVSLGECEIICVSASNGTVEARAKVHVQQPVQKIVLDPAPAVYVNEDARLYWHVEPENASNPALAFTSGNTKILTVSADGVVTGVQAGETYVNAVTTDGSRRQARVKVKVGKHVESAQMKRKAAYIDVGTHATTGAVLSPNDASNRNIIWEIEDPSVATVEATQKQPWRVTIHGVSAGQTVLKGVTEDGGYPVSMTVNVGEYEKALSLIKNRTVVNSGDGGITIRVKNISDLPITSITAQVSVTDAEGEPVPCNSKDDSNTFTVVYHGKILPGEFSQDTKWKYVNFKAPESPAVSEYEVKITEFQIDDDWVKTIRKKNQPTLKVPVHL